MTYSEIQQRAAAHYDDRYYTGHWATNLRATVVQRTFVLSPHISASDTLLDFGCSDGSILDALPGCRKAGIEINPVARAIAQRRGFDVRESIDSFHGEQFDRIVSSHCLEHVVDPLETLARLRNLLSEGGRLVLNLPMNDCRDRSQRRWRRGDINQHLYAWTPLTLGNMLAVAGFEPQIVRIHPFTYPSRLPGIAAISSRGYHWLARVYNIFRPRPQLLAVATPGKA